MDEFEVTYDVIRDEFPLAPDGRVTPMKSVQFRIGKHGPFWERFPAADFTPGALSARVETLRATLRNLPR